MAVIQKIPKEHSENGFDFSQANVALIVGAFVTVGLLVWSQPRIPTKNNGLAVQTIATPPVDQNMLAISKASQKPTVLGAATYNKDLINKFSNIVISTTDDNSITAIQNYANQVDVLEQNSKLSELVVSNLNDPNVDARRLTFVNDLKQIAVPSELADYHRLLIAYYSVNFLETHKDPDVVNKALDQIESQLQVMKASVLSTSGVELH